MPHSGTNKDQPRRTVRNHAQVRIHVVGRRSPEPLARTGIRANREELRRPLRATAPVPDRNTGAPKHRLPSPALNFQLRRRRFNPQAVGPARRAGRPPHPTETPPTETPKHRLPLCVLL
jgi:hypothetical protein